MCAFEDLLGMLNGEQLGIRVPKKKPVQHRNKAPMFYTAWEPLRMCCANPAKMVILNEAMEERFKTRTWTNPLPRVGRIPNYPKCGRCFATFVLSNAGAPAAGSAEGFSV